MTASPRIVNCPTCGQGVAWTAHNRWRPFCSERCKLIDLGAWATERYRVPVVENENRPEEAQPGESAGPAASGETSG
jgi:endogenous inhibitor of DNA gyrase (YacG/DUF329 family)